MYKVVPIIRIDNEVKRIDEHLRVTDVRVKPIVEYETRIDASVTGMDFLFGRKVAQEMWIDALITRIDARVRAND